MAADLLSVFDLLAASLTVSDLFRLSHALGAEAHHSRWTADLVAHVRRRLAVPRRCALPLFLSTYLRRPRCRECGAPSAAFPPRVCVPCARDPASFLLLLSRIDVRARYGAALRPRDFAHLFRSLPRAKRTRTGAFLYWVRDVEQAVQTIARQRTA